MKKHKIPLFLYTRIVQKQVEKGGLCYMNINMDIPGLKGVIIEKCEQLQECILLYISMPKRVYLCIQMYC